MALKIGSLYVSLTANSTGLVKGFAEAAKAAEKIARDVKRVANEVAAATAVMAGLGIVAVKMAATVDGPTKAALEGAERSVKVLAVQVADLLLPAVKEISDAFRTAAAWVAGLDPETRRSISSFAVLAVQLALGAKALSLVATMGGAVISVFRGIAAVIVTIGAGPLLEIVAVVAVVIAAVLLLHRAWRKNWGGIQEATASVVGWLKDAFGQFADFMGKVWDFLVDGAAKFVGALLDVGEKVEKLTGQNLGVAGMREGFAGMFKDLKSGSFFADAFKFGKTIAAEIAEGIADEAGRIKREVSEALGLDKIKKGTPIGLGRGMPSMHSDASSHDSAASHGSAERDRSGGGGTVGLSRDDMISGAVNASDWGEAQKVLKSGLDGAADFGTTLTVWGKRMSGVFAQAGQQIFGAVGTLVSAIAEGANKGGVIGAFMAGILEVVKSASSAMQFLGTAMEFVKQLGTMIEPLVKPVFDVLTDVLGAVIKILGPIFAALKPLFAIITDVINYLFPIISAIGSLFEALSPILEVVFKVIGMILQILEPIFKLVGGVIKVVATVLLGIIIGLNELAAAFGDKKAAAESKRLRKLVDDMWKEGADDRFRADSHAAGAAMRLAGSANTAADAAQNVADALTNVPSGYKIALARMNAMGEGDSVYGTQTGLWTPQPQAQASSSGFGNWDQGAVDPSSADLAAAEARAYAAYSDAIASGVGYAAAMEAGERARKVKRARGQNTGNSTGP